jgi:hypothetical protein
MSRYSTHLDLFTIGTDNNVISAYWDAATGWGGWFSLGKGMPGGQVAAGEPAHGPDRPVHGGRPGSGGAQVTEGYLDTRSWDSVNGWQPNWSLVRARTTRHRPPPGSACRT